MYLLPEKLNLPLNLINDTTSLQKNFCLVPTRVMRKSNCFPPIEMFSFSNPCGDLKIQENIKFS